ncbi:MAG: hypothetical protein Q9195_005333 [Heterodermia aff. obscurata]
MNEAYIIPLHAIIEDLKHVTHKTDVRLANLHEALQWALLYRPEHVDQLSTEPRPTSVGNIVADQAMWQGLHDTHYQGDKFLLAESMATGAQSLPTTAGRVDTNRASNLEHRSISANSTTTRKKVKNPESEHNNPGIVSNRRSLDDSIGEKAQNAQLSLSLTHLKRHAKNGPDAKSESRISQWLDAQSTSSLESRLAQVDDEQRPRGERFSRTSRDQRSGNGTSMLGEASDYNYRSSLPALSLVSSTPSVSVASSQIVLPEVHLKSQPNDADNEVLMPSRNRPILECPFNLAFLCLKSFSKEDDWIKHSLAHFSSNGRVIDPPTTNTCCFCDQTFYSPKPYESWGARMFHVGLHHCVGHTLQHARPDFALFKYLFENRLIDEKEYRVLKGGGYRHYSSRLPRQGPSKGSMKRKDETF